MQLRITPFIEGGLRYVFFDLTCQWGSSPGRSLLIFFFLITVFAIPYTFALLLPGRKDGIWLKWADDRIRRDLGTKKPRRLLCAQLDVAIVRALYFSFLSAVNLGWREINVGNWIQRIQANEYTLKASGWVRTISGIQSIISLYLIVLWALTYFGRPFD